MNTTHQQQRILDDRRWRDEQIALTRKREREEQERNQNKAAALDSELAVIQLDRELRDRAWAARSRQKNVNQMLHGLYPSIDSAFAEVGAYERAYGYSLYRHSYRHIKTQHVYKHRLMCWGFLPSTGAEGNCGFRLVIAQPFFENDGPVKFDIKHCNLKHTCAPEAIAIHKRPKVTSGRDGVSERVRGAFESTLSIEGATPNTYRRQWLVVAAAAEDDDTGCVSSGMRAIHGRDGSVNSAWGPVQYAEATNTARFRWQFNVKNTKNVIGGSCVDVFAECVMLRGGGGNAEEEEFVRRLGGGGGEDVAYLRGWLAKYGKRNAAMGVTYLIVDGVEPLYVQHTLMHMHKVYGFFVLRDGDDDDDDENVCSAPHASHAVFRISSGTALVISTECLRRYRMLTLQYQPFHQSMPRAPLLTQFWTLKARPPKEDKKIAAEEEEELWGQQQQRILPAAAGSDLTRRYGMLATLEFIVINVCGQLTNMRERMYGVHEPYFRIYELLPEILSMYDRDLKVPIWETVVLERLRHNTFFPSLVHFICQRNARADKGMKCKFSLRSTQLEWLSQLFGPDSRRGPELSARYPYAKYLLRHMVATGKSNETTYMPISIPANDWSKVKDMPATIPLPPKNCPLVYYLFELVGERNLLEFHERCAIYRAIGLQESYTREPRMVGTVVGGTRGHETQIPKKNAALLRNYDSKCLSDSLFPREQRHIPFTQIKREMIQLDALYHTLLGMEHTMDFCPVDPRVAGKHSMDGDPDPSKLWTRDLSTTGVYGLTRVSDPVHLATHQIDMPVACVMANGHPRKLLMFESTLYVHKGTMVAGANLPLLDAYMLIRDPTLIPPPPPEKKKNKK